MGALQICIDDDDDDDDYLAVVPCGVAFSGYPRQNAAATAGAAGTTTHHSTNKVDAKKQSTCKFDSTGMFHWCPSQSMSSCVVVSICSLLFPMLLLRRQTSAAYGCMAAGQSP